MTAVEEARRQWLNERPAFERFATELRNELDSHIRQMGIRAEVTWRAKEVHSLVKKLILKPRHTYASLGDKAGVRVVVRYRDQIEPVLEIANKLYQRGEPENTSARLDPDTLGYLSVHADVRLRTEDPRSAQFPPGMFHAELQVRTLAQHLWAEMAHDRVYKDKELLLPVPKDLQRRIYILAGVIELSDQEFNEVERLMPAVPELSVLKAMEGYYYQLTARSSDPQLSMEVIRLLSPLYHRAPAQIIDHLDEFFADRKETLLDVYEKAEHTADRSAFLFQPEALMIYDLLETDPDAVRTAWTGHFPEKELERIANAFGISFD